MSPVLCIRIPARRASPIARFAHVAIAIPCTTRLRICVINAAWVMFATFARIAPSAAQPMLTPIIVAPVTVMPSLVFMLPLVPCHGDPPTAASCPRGVAGCMPGSRHGDSLSGLVILPTYNLAPLTQNPAELSRRAACHHPYLHSFPPTTMPARLRPWSYLRTRRSAH